MNISVVIPAYNESENVKAAVSEILSEVKKVPDAAVDRVVVVDDHSTDGTFEVVSSMRDPRVVCIRLSRRSGSHTALRAGLNVAPGDAAVCITADGQDDPSCIREMVEKWRKGARIVWALRKDRKGEPLHIKIPARLFYRISTLFAGDRRRGIDLSRACFYLIDRTVVEAARACPERNTSLFGLIAWLGFSQDSVAYERRPRRGGRSKWSFLSRMNLAKDWLISFSGSPMKIFVSLGGVMALAGLIGTICAFVLHARGGSFKSWHILMATIAVIGGIQIVMLGILAEYIWRVLEESRGRPLYLIERRTDEK